MTPLSSDRKHGSYRKKQRDRQFTVALVTISLTFLILTLPRKLFLLTYTYVDGSGAVGDRMNFVMNYLLGMVIVDKLWYLNCAINVWLFALTSSRFRTDIKQIFCRCFSKTKNSRSGGDEEQS